MTCIARRRLGAGVAAVVALGVVVLAARSRPFTWPADILTTVVLVAVVVLVLAQRSRWRHTWWVRRRRERGIGGAPETGRRRWRGRWAVWAVPAGAIAAWELFCYFGAPRDAHPTLSSMLDVVTSTPWGRGAVFVSWSALGWFLVTR